MEIDYENLSYYIHMKMRSMKKAKSSYMEVQDPEH